MTNRDRVIGFEEEEEPAVPFLHPPRPPPLSDQFSSRDVEVHIRLPGCRLSEIP